MYNITLTLPLILTLIRLLISPIVMPIAIQHFIARKQFRYQVILAAIFIALAITDFFDGYSARLLGQESELGRLLDPLADKILMLSTFITLVAVQRLAVSGALIFIGREVFVTALREIVAVYGGSVPVMMGGKIKTAVQMVYVIVLILTAQQVVGPWKLVERLLYYSALSITIVSALLYCWYAIEQVAFIPY